jgi:hypothetical protein
VQQLQRETNMHERTPKHVIEHTALAVYSYLRSYHNMLLYTELLQLLCRATAIHKQPLCKQTANICTRRPRLHPEAAMHIHELSAARSLPVRLKNPSSGCAHRHTQL